ncbi:lycopene cyclase domain-containing protein [Luteimicrobium sp. DT211]|uniref:lycopene cyclase domain-containing protein n=1 Tax=Luteimicrobium sp. DT211 TaxID=3393412 RepID=UPI003CF76FBB
MRGAYLLALLVSLAGLGVLDARFRLVLARDLRRGLATLGTGLAAFLAWDLAGIGLGIFRRGDGRWSTGVEILPHLPVEEPVFLVLLCYVALELVEIARRVTDRGRGRHARPRASARGVPR